MVKIKYLIFPLSFQILLRLTLRPIAKFFLRYEVRGLENLKHTKGGVIFAANHISELDSGLIPIAFPISKFLGPFFFTSLAKHEYSHKGLRGKLFYGGLLFHLVGARKVYRGLNDYSLSIKHHLDLLLNNESILIFPEGRASRDGLLGKTGGGTTFLAYKSKKPIIPIKLEGIWNMSFDEFLKRERKLIITIGQPIVHESLFENSFLESKENFKQKSTEVLKIISNL